MSKTKIRIDYSKCGDKSGFDPRNCGKCLRNCEPAVFLLHESLDYENEDDPYDPQIWRVTPVYLSLCTHCMKCVELCPEKAVTVK